MVSLVSSPGAGKTALLEKTLAGLKPTHRVAALVGDLATDNDAARLARAGVPVRQITTGTRVPPGSGEVSRAGQEEPAGGVQPTRREQGQRSAPEQRAGDVGVGLALACVPETEQQQRRGAAE